MKINGFLAFLTLFLFIVLFSNVFYPLRYGKYLLPHFALPAFFLGNHRKVHTTEFKYYYYLLIFYSFAIVFLGTYHFTIKSIAGRFIANSIFILSPLLYLIFIQPLFREELVKRYVILILYFNILIFFITEGSDFLSIFTNGVSLFGAILSSEFPTESNLAYVFGLIFLFFVLEKYPLRYKVVALLFLVLSFKRVVLGATFISLMVYFVFSIFKIRTEKNRGTLVFIGVLVNLLFIKVTQVIVEGTYDNYVYEQTGFSMDRFLMGRKTFYSEAFDKAGDFNWIGVGIGRIDEIIYSFYGIPVNLHSEILKNYLEFGFIIFVVWLVILFYQNLLSVKTFIFFIFLNLLLLTDNVFIYFEVMFYFYFFTLIFLNQKKATLKAYES